MKARLYLGDKLLGETELAAAPAMLQERHVPRRYVLPAVGDTITVALFDDADPRSAHPLFLTGRLERA
jgi:hypothetical protein